jgi:hypothetical protein
MFASRIQEERVSVLEKVSDGVSSCLERWSSGSSV